MGSLALTIPKQQASQAIRLLSKPVLQEALLITATSTALKSVGCFARIIDTYQSPDKFKLPLNLTIKRESLLLGMSAIATLGVQLLSSKISNNLLFKFGMTLPPLILAEVLCRKLTALKDFKFDSSKFTPFMNQSFWTTGTPTAMNTLGQDTFQKSVSPSFQPETALQRNSSSPQFGYLSVRPMTSPLSTHPPSGIHQNISPVPSNPRFGHKDQVQTLQTATNPDPFGMTDPFGYGKPNRMATFHGFRV